MSKKKIKISFPKTGFDDIARLATVRSIERGADIYYSDQVRSVKVIDNGLSAIVGSNAYQAKINWDRRKQSWDFSCTCPYDWGGICKHLVALGYWMAENCEEKGDGSTKNRKEEISQLIKEADENIKDEILLEALLNDDTLIGKMKTKIAVLESSPGEESTDELVTKYLEWFRDIALPDEEEAFERNNRPYDYYVEEWEMAEEIQREELEFQTSEIFDNMERLLKTGRILEAVFNLIALQEALGKYEEEDEYDNLPDGETIDLFRDYFDEKIKEMYRLLNDQIINLETQEKILETIILKYKNKIPFYSYEDLLINISFDKITAAKLLNILQQEQYKADCSKLQIKLVEILDNEELKLSIFERFAFMNNHAASYLLHKYLPEKKEYHRIAEKVVSEHNKTLNAEIFSNLDPAENLELYKKTALLLYNDTCDINYYRKYKAANQVSNYKELLENYPKGEFLMHAFMILIEEKKFSEAFDLFNSNNEYILNGKKCLPYLIPALPEKCFSYITQKAIKMLKQTSSRSIYADAGFLLSLLLEYPDKELKRQGKVLIEQICKKYWNRRAMLDEFRRKGIKC
jgi:hypothetical protein